ncbi:MAG: DNA breaking-rejoining protein [Lysobacter sp.]
MKTIPVLCVSLLGMVLATHAHAQSVAPESLRQAATGASFKVGDIQFRLAPAATVTAADASADPAQTVVAGKYAVEVGAAPSRSKRSLDGASAAPAAKLAAAVSQSGEPVVVTSSVNVYFDQPDVLAEAVRSSGGKLTYSSVVGGKGTIEFDSVQQALDAVARLQGIAGIKEASPKIEQLENMVL